MQDEALMKLHATPKTLLIVNCIKVDFRNYLYCHLLWFLF